MEPTQEQIAHLKQEAARLHEQGDYLAAIPIYEQLISQQVTDAHLWFAHADACASAGQYARSLLGYSRSLEYPRFEQSEQVRHQLARAYYQLGQVDQAVRLLRQAVDRQGAMISRTGLATIIPGAPSASSADVLQTRQEFLRHLATQSPLAPSTPKRTRHQYRDKLRVGYLSSFFYTANYMKPVWAAINHHDRNRLELHLLCDQPRVESCPGYLPQTQDTWHSLSNCTNQELHSQLVELDLDILVDLNGYSSPSRLEVLLERPARHTVAWFNAFATSGLPHMDVMIGDRVCIRSSERQYYSERLLALPLSYLTFEVAHAVPDVVEPPSLRNGYLTFGSLVAQYKITVPVLDAWAEILHRVPGSRLLLANRVLGDRNNQEFVRRQFSTRGIDPERLDLRGPAEHYTYLKNYGDIDIALDSFPYSGGTTTMEAIWQGVPVLTWNGDRWASRTSASLLANCHLATFVHDGIRGMVDQAVELASSASGNNWLATMRHEMRDRLRGSSVMQGRSLAGYLERIFTRLANQGQDH